MGEEIIAIGVILLIMGIAITYVIKAKKSGKKCIGCPDGATCSHNKKSCNGNCYCCSKGKTD